MKTGKRRKARPKLTTLEKQIERAEALALQSAGLVRELFLLHKEICEQHREKMKARGPRSAS